MNPRRLCRAAIVSILLGILTTLVFAWGLPLALTATGLARPSPWTPDRFWIDDTRGGHYQVASQAFVAATHFQHIIFDGAPSQQPYYLKDPPPSWAFTLLHSMKGDPPADTQEWWGVDTFTCGWPFRAFRGGQYEPWPVQTTSAPAFIVQSGVRVPAPVKPSPFTVGLYRFGGTAGDRFVIPLRPIPKGLILNTLIFSAEWMSILALVALGRAWARARRGACPVCGYDMGGLSPGTPCPECGGDARVRP